MVLVIVWFVSYWLIICGEGVATDVISPPSVAAVAPLGALKIKPYQLPRTFTKTSSAFFPMIELPVRLKVVMLVVLLPVVAFPAVVFLSTLALPLTAVAVVAFDIDWLTDVSRVPELLLGTVIDRVGTLLASSSSMKWGGNKMSPLRLPSMLIIPRNDFPLTMVEFKKFRTFATAVAFPEVALPAVVLAATRALPLVAATDISLLTAVSVVE